MPTDWYISSAHEVNESGQIAGTAHYEVTGETVPMFFDPAGPVVYLLNEPMADGNAGWAINDFGDVASHQFPSGLTGGIIYLYSRNLSGGWDREFWYRDPSPDQIRGLNNAGQISTNKCHFYDGTNWTIYSQFINCQDLSEKDGDGNVYIVGRINGKAKEAAYRYNIKNGELVKYDSSSNDAAFAVNTSGDFTIRGDSGEVFLYMKEYGAFPLNVVGRNPDDVAKFTSAATRLPSAITERGTSGFGTIAGRAWTQSSPVLYESFVLKPVARK